MDLSFLLENNPWRRDVSAIERDRHVVFALSKERPLVYEFSDERNTIVVGPRRAGKTTYFKLLMRDLMINKGVSGSDVFYVSCEILKGFDDILDIFRFVDSRYIFLDEVTFIDGWERAVKYALDQGMLEDRTLYITGSSTAYMRSETFPGRDIRFMEFLPLNFLEYCLVLGSGTLRSTLDGDGGIEGLIGQYSEIFRLFNAFLESGGFPGPTFDLHETGVVAGERFDGIYSWFRGDILKLGRNEELMKALVSRLLETLTTPVSYNALGNHVGISHRIAREYLETLKTLMYLDYCYAARSGRPAPDFRKEKKIYFSDPFIVQVFERKLAGKKTVDESRMTELVAYNALRLAGEVYFLDSQGGRETDFLHDGVKLEVKWSERPRARKGSTVLSKKDYLPDKGIIPLPAYLLDTLKRNGKRRI